MSLLCATVVLLPALPARCSVQAVQASRICQPPTIRSGGVSRRQQLSVAAAGVLSVLSVQTAAADETFSKMGGALEPYIDVQKGYKLYRPTAWNQFDTDPGVYDVKFQDVINSFETVQVSSSPVTTATSISALGDIASVAAKFAKSRNAALVSSSERDADGSLLYSMELQGDMYHEYLALTINRGKLFRLSTVTSNKRWPKRQELYKNVVLSFVPKGF